MKKCTFLEYSHSLRQHKAILRTKLMVFKLLQAALYGLTQNSLMNPLIEKFQLNKLLPFESRCFGLFLLKTAIFPCLQAKLLMNLITVSNRRFKESSFEIGEWYKTFFLAFRQQEWRAYSGVDCKAAKISVSQKPLSINTFIPKIQLHCVRPSKHTSVHDLWGRSHNIHF